MTSSGRLRPIIAKNTIAVVVLIIVATTVATIAETIIGTGVIVMIATEGAGTVTPGAAEMITEMRRGATTVPNVVGRSPSGTVKGRSSSRQFYQHLQRYNKMFLVRKEGPQVCPEGCI